MKKMPYATQWIDEEDIRAVSQALRADYLTQGPRIEAFEKAVADYCGAKYAVAVNSGTSALHAACFAAGIKTGDEVITSPITFVASANCVLYCGGQPVFADVDEKTINIAPQEISKKITAKTKALIPVHFTGQPCVLEAIQKLAKKHKLLVIEDACHALGAEYKGAKIGSCEFSDMTVLSFHAVKHITTGEGGMVLTNNKELYERLKMFRTHGITRENNNNVGPWFYEMRSLGFNYRITDFQCELGLQQLRKLDGYVKRRREIVDRYLKAFAGLKNIILLPEQDGVKSSWHLFCVKVKGDRKEIFTRFREKGLLVNVHYIPVYQQPYYQQLGYKPGLCPEAEKYYAQAITLPLFPKMSDEDVDYVIQSVKEVVQ